MFARLRNLVLGVATVSIGAVHGPLIGYKTYANVDEAYAVALAARVLDGYKLYTGAVSQRGPLMYYAFTALAWMHGWDNIVALRMWALVFALLHFFGIYWAARVLVSRTGAIVAACVAGYALTFGFPAYDGIALHGETLQMPALIVAVVLGALGIRAPPGSVRRRGMFAATGLLLGVALVIKQSVALHPIPIVLWALVDARRRRTPLRTWGPDVGILVVTMFVVPAICVANAWREGTLHELYYYTVVYNRDVHLRPTTKVFPVLTQIFLRLLDHTSFFVATFTIGGILAAGCLRRARRAIRLRSLHAALRGFGPRQYVYVHLVLAVAAASSMYRFFPHYYLQALPFMALAVGALSDRWLARRSSKDAAPVVVGMMMFVLGCGAMATIFGERIDGRVAHDRTSILLGHYIQATTSPRDRIFVWGFSPMIYGYSHRKPAGRYVFETYVTGMVPWYWDSMDVEQKRIVPGSVEALLADLDREDPPVVVDGGSVMLARSMRAYDLPNAWLHARYCFEVRIGAYDVYRRKPAAGCAHDVFPVPHEATTWIGIKLGIPVPFTKDHAAARRLPKGNPFHPLWFAKGPRPPEAGILAAKDKQLEEDEAKGLSEGFAVPTFDPDHPEPDD